jgi:hypothetical protein
MSDKYNYVTGDQISQKGGRHNVIKTGKKSGATTQALSVSDRAQAVTELADFIAYLERLGVVSTSGQITDTEALGSAVIAQQSKLRGVAKAIASGAGDVLSNVFNHAAVPVILGLIGQIN